MNEARQSPAVAARARRWLRGLRPDAGNRVRRRVAGEIYHQLVNQARMPALYRGLGVPDTPEGRFEMVALHVALAWRRLRVAGAAGNVLGQDLFDLMLADVDESLRQIGIGDLSVGKQVRRLAGQFYARLKALDEALAAAPPGSLRAMLRTNVYHGGAPPSERQLDALVGYLMAIDEALRAHSAASLFAGRLRLVPPQEPMDEGAATGSQRSLRPALSAGEAVGGAAKSIDRLRPWPYLGGRFFSRFGPLAEMPLLPTNEFSRRLVIDPWPDAGIEVDVTADRAERAALARRFNLVEVRSLRGRGRLERRGKPAELVLRGWLEADVVQSCIVSLEPVPAKLRQPVERRYRPEGGRTAGPDRFQPIGALDLDDDAAEVEPLVGREIDLGEAFAEELGLALDPYPRAADAAAIEATALGPHVRLGPAEPGKAFAALRQLQEKRAR